MKKLTLIDKAFLLKRTPIFNALDLDLLLTIADKLGAVVFKAGDYVFSFDEEANRMYFVIRGQVEIHSLSNQTIDRLSEGDFFGEESLFNNKPRAYAAFTPIETYVLTLSRTNLYTIISECPLVAVGFLQVYTSVIDYCAIKPLEKNL